MAKTSHRKIFIMGGIAATIMFGFCFAIVPLYSLICQATGISTSVRTSQLVIPAVAGTTKQVADLSREINIQFIAMNHMGMPWDFYPKTKSIRVHPGENKTVYFYAKNTTSRLMTVQAIPSMTPVEALSHFHKIECFCFNQQTLKAGESKDMALVFNVDKDLPKETHVITLQYTLFDATPKVKEPKKG